MKKTRARSSLILLCNRVTQSMRMIPTLRRQVEHLFSVLPSPFARSNIDFFREINCLPSAQRVLVPALLGGVLALLVVPLEVGHGVGDVQAARPGDVVHLDQRLGLEQVPPHPESPQIATIEDFLEHYYTGFGVGEFD